MVLVAVKDTKASVAPQPLFDICLCRASPDTMARLRWFAKRAKNWGRGSSHLKNKMEEYNYSIWGEEMNREHEVNTII